MAGLVTEPVAESAVWVLRELQIALGAGSYCDCCRWRERGGSSCYYHGEGGRGGGGVVGGVVMPCAVRGLLLLFGRFHPLHTFPSLRISRS